MIYWQQFVIWANIFSFVPSKQMIAILKSGERDMERKNNQNKILSKKIFSYLFIFTLQYMWFAI